MGGAEEGLRRRLGFSEETQRRGGMVPECPSGECGLLVPGRRLLAGPESQGAGHGSGPQSDRLWGDTPTSAGISQGRCLAPAHSPGTCGGGRGGPPAQAHPDPGTARATSPTPPPVAPVCGLATTAPPCSRLCGPGGFSQQRGTCSLAEGAPCTVPPRPRSVQLRNWLFVSRGTQDVPRDSLTTPPSSPWLQSCVSLKPPAQAPAAWTAACGVQRVLRTPACPGADGSPSTGCVLDSNERPGQGLQT